MMVCLLNVLTFLELENHTGVNMANMVVNYLTEKGIDFSKCRGQSYDNAAYKSQKYKGMQQVKGYKTKGRICKVRKKFFCRILMYVLSSSK